MNRIILLTGWLFLTALTGNLLFAQETKTNYKRDSANTVITAFEDNRDGTVFTGMYEILKGIQPISFANLFPRFWVRERPMLLREGEGKNGYLLEANIDQTFTLMQGRNQAKKNSWQRMRLAFRYAPAIRMTLDSSNPIYPSNQKVGLDFSYAIWDNYSTNSANKDNKSLLSYDTTWIDQQDLFQVVHLLVQANHYSNGQPPGAIASTTPLRNDYKKGDFSTNFISLMGVYSVYTAKHQLYSIGLGYRIDGAVGETFAFNPAQNNRYGKHRVLFLGQVRTQPKWTILTKKFRWVDLRTNKEYCVQGKLSHRFRIESELIMGNMSKFERSKNYRLGTHFFYEMDFLRWRTSSLIFHFYTGRDYFNIRYDDIVYGGGIGLSFSLTKYKPPRLKSSSFIKYEIPGESEKLKRIKAH